MAIVLPGKSMVGTGDITSNLPSLTFESALTDDELQLMYLRTRSHALTVSACAQATYFVSVCNEAKQIKADLSCNAKQRRAMRLLQEGIRKDYMTVGIIGCGRLGSHLANCLLTYGEVQPDELLVSTRRPETLGDLQTKGVRCYFDNKKVASSCNIIFLCILPSQIEEVVEEIKGIVSSRCLVYSFVTGVQVGKLKQLLKCDSIIGTYFEYSMETRHLPWNCGIDINTSLAEPDMLEKTCPLSLHKNESVVTTDAKFAEIMVYAFVNLCTSLNLPQKETLDIVHAVLFGQTSLESLSVRLTEDDFVKFGQTNDSEYFPRFSLVEMASIETPLLTKLVEDEELREAFVKRYLHVFEQYLQWKKYNEGI